MFFVLIIMFVILASFMILALFNKHLSKWFCDKVGWHLVPSLRGHTVAEMDSQIQWKQRTFYGYLFMAIGCCLMIIGIPVVIHLPNLWHQPHTYDCIPNLITLPIFSTVLILVSSTWAIPLKGGLRIFFSKIGLLFLCGILFVVGYILAFVVGYFLAIYGVPGYDLM